MNPLRCSSNLIIVSAILASMLVIAVLGLYFFQFNNGLASNSSDWADFGSYIGGTLGPVFAFMAFALGLHTFNQTQKLSRRDELLKSIQGYERDFETCISKPVTCQSPWIWGNELDSANNVKEVALRTLLQSDGIDWKHHLSDVANSLTFRVLPDGELVQDRDIWLRAHSAVEGIFRYINLYSEAGGDKSLVNYLVGKYEISRNRLAISGEISNNDSTD